MKQVSITKNSLFPNSPLHLIYPSGSFSKYCLILLFAGIMLLVSSCHKEDHNCKKTVPLKGEFVTSVMLIVPPSPGVLEQFRDTGKGSGTPFGKATFESNITVDITASPEIISGTETITGENGDQIFATISGYSPGPDANGNVQVFNTNTIIGGSGKYAGATGAYKKTFKGSITSPTGTDTLDGTITLDECHGNKWEH